MTQDKGGYHGEESRVVLPYHQGWVGIVLERGRAVKRTTQLKCPEEWMQRARERRYSCCTEGDMWLCPRYIIK